MKQREKMLTAGLVATLALWQGSLLLNHYVFAPVEEGEREITAREDSISSKTKKLKKAQADARRLKDWNLRSLPPDPVVAASMYQVWLVELATKSKLTNPTVTPNRTDAKLKGDAYHVISATIKAQGTLSQLCDFLYEFRKSGLLHRVSRMSLSTEQNQGDPQLAIDLTVEGLALKDSPPRTALLADEKLAEISGMAAAKDRTAFAPLLAKNPFVRGYNGPPRPPGPPGRSPQEDDRQFVYFTGAYSNGGPFDAMLYDRSNDKKENLREGTAFNVAGIDGKVLSVAIDHMTIEIKGEPWRWELGDNLTQLKKLPPPAKAEAAPPDAAGAPRAATD